LINLLDRPSRVPAALITAGTLKQTQANSLLAKLTNVLNSGGSGRIGAFINE